MNRNLQSVMAGTCVIELLLTLITGISNAQASPGEASSVSDMFSEGKVSGNIRTLYYSAHNAFFTPGKNQDTISYGGKLAFTSGNYNGFGFGLSGLIQRGIFHDDDINGRDTYLGPNITALGEAYGQYQHENLILRAGNQQLDLPFASTYDYRIAPQLFQGVYARYGDNDNHMTAARIYRYKSYIDDSFSKHTNYNSRFDSFSSIGEQETDGFWGVGGMRTLDLAPVIVKAQGWHFNYEDYARLNYVEAKISRRDGNVIPFFAVQAMHEDQEGKALLGNIRSRVYGAQLGVKQQSVTVSLGFDRIVPDSQSYLNGATVTPYAHNVTSGPFFAQPFLTSTQDLGAGNAYALDINGAASEHLFVGGRYSFMDLKKSAAAESIKQSEYLLFGTYKFGGKLKGVSITNYIALQSSPPKSEDFWQNRLKLQYDF
ncbi:OprD family outer membrane porin [Pseudomonas fluorescens]|uniref:OprD family outer membrane porin n=1 Tax=Pseudomonas fluorescens TaxID=294 RepID=UPI0027885318|nr:OprD family outer membrane porin [Pseudomonas fluorescens]MDP9784407.1 hypothetical protein [Pseudomonas fluorescens]